jgi:hypothetical protein
LNSLRKLTESVFVAAGRELLHDCWELPLAQLWHL